MAPTGDSKPGVTPLISLISGGTAGGIEATITYPFEFAKTRVQLRAEAGVPTPRNPFVVVGQVLKNEGVKALYTGCTTLVLGTIAKDAIRFMSFDTIKQMFKDAETGSLSPLRSLLAGMSAGVVASTFAVTPTERLKTALIDDRRVRVSGSGGGGGGEGRRFNGAWHATKIIVKEQGFYGLYRGYVTTTMKQAGTTSVRMGTYNVLKEVSAARDIPQNTLTSFGNGAIAGIVTTYATQPFDMIKTRAQAVRSAGIVEASKDIWQEYGIRGFWRGSTMRLGRTVLSGGILFTAYEQVSALLVPIIGRKE